MRLFKGLAVCFAYMIGTASHAHAQSESVWANVVQSGCSASTNTCYLRLSVTTPNPNACSSSWLARWPVADPLSERFLSLSMTALASSREAKIVVSSSECLSNSPSVQMIEIR